MALWPPPILSPSPPSLFLWLCLTDRLTDLVHLPTSLPTHSPPSLPTHPPSFLCVHVHHFTRPLLHSARIRLSLWRKTRRDSPPPPPFPPGSSRHANRIIDALSAPASPRACYLPLSVIIAYLTITNYLIHSHYLFNSPVLFHPAFPVRHSRLPATLVLSIFHQSPALSSPLYFACSLWVLPPFPRGAKRKQTTFRKKGVGQLLL